MGGLIDRLGGLIDKRGFWFFIAVAFAVLTLLSQEIGLAASAPMLLNTMLACCILGRKLRAN